MLNISAYSKELIRDPFGILEGERYEFILDIEVPEDDELYSENGLYLKVLYGVSETKTGIIKYEIYERSSEQYLEFELEEDELKEVENFCIELLNGTTPQK